jgi:hypothetical protein
VELRAATDSDTLSTFAKKAAKNAGLSRLFSPMSSSRLNKEVNNAISQIQQDKYVSDIGPAISYYWSVNSGRMVY